MPHKVQVQAATVAGLGEGRVVEEVLFSEEQGTLCAGIEPRTAVSIKYSTLYVMP